MQRMVRYQIRYQKHHINIMQSSAVSLKLYFALREFFDLAKKSISDRWAIVFCSIIYMY